MFGKKDFHSGGYGFNFRIVEYFMHHPEWMDLRNKLKAFMYRMYVRWLLGMAGRIWTNSKNTMEALNRTKSTLPRYWI